jgi:hypothetical protein
VPVTVTAVSVATATVVAWKVVVVLPVGNVTVAGTVVDGSLEVSVTV